MSNELSKTCPSSAETGARFIRGPMKGFIPQWAQDVTGEVARVVGDFREGGDEKNGHHWRRSPITVDVSYFITKFW